MLGGDDDGLGALGDAERVLDRDLRLAVGAQVGEGAVLAQTGEAQAEVVGEVDGQRHQLFGLVAGEAEHDALVAGALVLADGGVDLLRLLLDRDEHAAAVGVEGVLGPRVADVADDLAGDAGAVDVVLGADLAEDEDEAGGGGDLAGDVGVRVVGEDVVEDGVGDLVADLVGVALGDGLGGHEERGEDMKVMVIAVSSSFGELVPFGPCVRTRLRAYDAVGGESDRVWRVNSRGVDRRLIPLGPSRGGWGSIPPLSASLPLDESGPGVTIVVRVVNRGCQQALQQVSGRKARFSVSW